MPVPTGLPGPVADYLQQLEDRISALENPQGPGKLFACTTANMPTATDAANYQTFILNTTLNILAHCDGTQWIREDTGAAI